MGVSGRGIFQGVVDHVHQDPFDQHEIQWQQGQILRDIYLDGSSSHPASQVFQSRANQVLDIAGLFFYAHGARFQAGHIQQVAHQAVEPVGFFAGSLDQAAPG